MPKPACISELHYGLNVWLACFREAFEFWLPAFDTDLQMQPEMLCHDGMEEERPQKEMTGRSSSGSGGADRSSWESDTPMMVEGGK